MASSQEKVEHFENIHILWQQAIQVWSMKEEQILGIKPLSTLVTELHVKVHAGERATRTETQTQNGDPAAQGWRLKAGLNPQRKLRKAGCETW